MQKYLFPVFLAISAIISAFALSGSSCDKRSAASPEAGEVVAAIDKAEGKGEPKADPKAGDGKTQAAGTAAPKPAAAPAQPVSSDPIPGVDVSKLSADKAKAFFTMASTLPSPCGKAHSLRTSIMEDTTCKRSSFAARYVIEMLVDEASESEAKELYELRYKNVDAPRKTFKLDKTPYSGAVDAPVKVVEFYDYGCPTCKQFVPLLKEALASYPDQAVLYYKQFPLPSHVHSKGAAQAALAAHEQGKFQQMHEILFARSPNHTRAELSQYAKSIGLDMGRFEANFVAMQPRVEADVAEGNAAGVDGTPTIYINGKQYEGPTHPKYLGMWIEEELAVNR
ncbi:MAG TPA: thioredoxin domain-containing protein [Haliangium sp.]|nr:thioredoxin domain-containing protein [Haliangium sp.]